MNITNMYGAPKSILQAVTADPYTKGEADFSVTELIKPPQINRLWAEHENKISIDVRDEIWKLLGRGVHNVLEQYSDGGVSEERHFAKVGDVTVSGAIDLVDNGMVTDYKVTSTYSVTKGLKVEWEQQLNMYSWLLRQNDISSNNLRIVAICRIGLEAGVIEVKPTLPVLLQSFPYPSGRMNSRISTSKRGFAYTWTNPPYPAHQKSDGHGVGIW